MLFTWFQPSYFLQGFKRILVPWRQSVEYMDTISRTSLQKTHLQSEIFIKVFKFIIK